MGCFHLLAVVNNAAVNIRIHIWTLVFFSFGSAPGVGLWVPMATMGNLCEADGLFCKVAAPCHGPPSMSEGSGFSASPGFNPDPGPGLGSGSSGSLSAGEAPMDRKQVPGSWG